MDEALKRCPQCNRSKPRSAFNKNRSKHDGLAVQCRDCRRESQREGPEVGSVVGRCGNELCGAELRRKSDSGPLPKFCSAKCRAARHHELERQERMRVREGRTCAREGCEEPIPAEADGNKRYCSRSCTGKVKWQRVKADPERLARRDEKIRALQVQKYDAMTPVERAVWSLQRRAANGVKRAREAGAEVQEVDLLRDVIKPSELVCFVCGGRVALVLGVKGKPDPLSIGIDHIIAIEDGGNHTAENLALVHHGCNALKQDRGLEWAREKATPRDAPTPTVANLHAFYGALAVTSGGVGVVLDVDNGPLDVEPL